MKCRLLLMALSVPFFCSCANFVWTSKPLIVKPSDHDFGIVGKWEQVPDPRIPATNQPSTIEVSRDQDTKTIYTVTPASQSEVVEFVASRLAADSERAVIQIKTLSTSGKPSYFYAYALRTDDQLQVWMIQGDQLVKQIKSEKLNAVIDRGIISTEVTAESAKLLKLLTVHASTLASKDPITLKLKR